jgi:3-oxoacyl-(acyl-carrier-protein) synthase
VAIVGAAALSSYGEGWRGLGRALAAGARPPAAGIHAEDPDAEPAARRKARKMMSRGAYLAARCLGRLLGEVAWTAAERERAGYFLGVGASGGSLDDVIALLDASIADGAFSLARFGEQGLAACNPLLAFQLMNNFTLCHGAILEGIGGPNGAIFSRGAGTTAALIEAVHAIAEGECERAVAGGADSAIHPVTRAELQRDGFLARGLVPAEGGGLVALAAAEGGGGEPAGLAVIEGLAIASGAGGDAAAAGAGVSPPDAAAIDEAVAAAMAMSGRRTEDVDCLVLAPWGPPAGEALRAWAATAAPGAGVVDISAGFGDALAATPALAWIATLDLIVAQRARRALVLAAGTDGDVGAALFAGGGA